MLDRQTVTRIFGLCVRLFGIEYTDSLLRVLQEAYVGNAEGIVIHRRPRSFG